MRTRSTITLLIILAILIGAGVIGYSGVKIGSFTIAPVRPNLGLDIQGGLSVYLEAEDTAEIKVDDQKMDEAVAALKNRIDALNLKEPEVTREGARRIKIALPGVRDSQEALDVIGKRAYLEVKNPTGETVLTGADLTNAQAQIGSDGQPYIQLTLTNEAAKKFGQLTTDNVGKRLPILLDGEVIMAPIVQDGGIEAPTITNVGDMAEASRLATLLRSGFLPVQFKSDPAVYTVGPTLGQDSLAKSVFAGAIGSAAVVLFMLLFYRLCGLVASVALTLYIGLTLLVFVQLGATLTLPGIAGLILSVGMAVDTNILIFERIKEELRAGKTLRSAVGSGFTRAFSAILDSNVTTLIAAALLYYFGSDQVQGFAVTLSIGVVLSMFTAITFTRFVLRHLVNTGLFKNPKLYVNL